MKRPVGFTILAVILAWLTITGLGNAAVAAAAPETLRAFGLQPAVLIFATLAYAGTAALTATGLWRVAPWSGRAAAAWALACNAAALVFAAMTGRAGLWPMPAPLFLVCILPFLCLPWLLVVYVQRRLRTRIPLDGVRRLPQIPSGP